MSRIPTDYIEMEFGEDAIYSPSPVADRWSCFRRTDIMAPMNRDHVANPLITHGGAPPQWVSIGGWSITADVFIPPSRAANAPRAPAEGFEGVASAGGFTVPWDNIAAATADGLREALMVIAYADGKAFRRTIIRAPASSAIDPAVIAAQERRLLQSLLIARDQAAGRGGAIKIDSGEGVGEEFESLAVLDRRIAEARARIAWFEQAAEGNNLPRATYW